MMKRWSLVVVTAFAAACGGGSKKPAPVAVKPAEPAPPAPPPVVDEQPALPAIPSTPVAAPEGLMATAQVANPRGMVAALAGYIELVHPGMGGAVTVDALVEGLAEGGLDLHGADLAQPVRLLVLDPNQFHQPFVAVVTVGDQATLTAAAEQHGLRIQQRGNLAVVGTYDALVATGGYALTTLASQPMPQQPTAELDVKYLVERYGSMLEMLAAGASAQADDPKKAATMQATMQMYIALFHQIDKLAITADVQGDHATVVTRMIPLPDTALAAFVGRQKPARFTLLEQVPAGPFAAGGFLDLQAVWQSFGDAMAPMMEDTYGPAAPALMDFWKKFVTLETGENAISADVSSSAFGMSGLWEVGAPAVATKLWTDYFKAISKGGLPTMDVKTGTASYKGAKILTSTMTPGKGLPEDQKAFYDRMGGKLMGGFAVVGKLMVFSVGTDATPRIKALVDGSKKPGTPGPGLTTAIAGARALGESYLIAIDAGELRRRFDPAAPKAGGPIEPATVGIGATGGALAFRITVPAAQIKAVHE